MHTLNGFVPGMSSVIQKKIEEADTAAYCGNGVFGKLLATPVYVDLIIKASTDIVDPLLPEGFVSVGRAFSFTHEAPTALGMTIRVQSTLEKVDGSRMFFNILACDDLGEIGHGTHERIIVNEDVLWQKAIERMGGKVPELKKYRI